MVTIIEGNWYKNKMWGSRQDFVKAIKLVESDSVYASEYIRNGKYYKENCTWVNASKCEKATIEEVSQFLPSFNILTFLEIY